MLVYEIVLDGELDADLTDPSVPIERRDRGGTTILRVPALHALALSRALGLLGSLGIGVIALHRVDDARGDCDHLPALAGIGVSPASTHPRGAMRAPRSRGHARAVRGQPRRRQDMSVNVDVGPIDYLALEFPGARLTGEGMAILVDLVDRGIIRILDMRALVRGQDGAVTAMAISDLDGDGTLDLAVFDGVESDLLDEEDLEHAASLVEPGNAVALLVYENTWAGPFVSAMRRAGAEVVASVRIPADAVIARLESLDALDGPVGLDDAPARSGGPDTTQRVTNDAG